MAFREILSTVEFREKKSPETEAEDQHILECQYRRGVSGCGECSNYDSCEVLKNHLRAKVGLPPLGDGSLKDDG
jgi:hypothetical protein